MHILLNYFQWLAFTPNTLAYTSVRLASREKSEYTRLPALETIPALPRRLSYINYNYLILVYYGMPIGSENMTHLSRLPFCVWSWKNTLNLIWAICDSVYYHKKVKIPPAWLKDINTVDTTGISLIFGGR